MRETILDNLSSPRQALSHQVGRSPCCTATCVELHRCHKIQLPNASTGCSFAAGLAGTATATEDTRVLLSPPIVRGSCCCLRAATTSAWLCLGAAGGAGCSAPKRPLPLPLPRPGCCCAWDPPLMPPRPGCMAGLWWGVLASAHQHVTEPQGGSCAGPKCMSRSLEVEVVLPSQAVGTCPTPWSRFLRCSVPGHQGLTKKKATG